MVLPLSGSAAVTIDLDILEWTGAPLYRLNCVPGAAIALDGLVYFVQEPIDTSHVRLTRPYTGASGTVTAEIEQLSPEQVATATLNKRAADVGAQLSALDANGRGLFYNLIGVTGPGDPGPGNMAFNHADPAQVTAIYLDVLDANEGGRNVAGLIALLEPGTVLVARSLASSAYASFIVTEAPSGVGGFRTLSVAPVPSGADGALSTEPLAIEWRLPGADKDVDGEADTQASRNALFGGEAVGFRVMVRNYLGGRAARTTKVGPAADAWSGPAYWTGADGAPSTVPGPPGPGITPRGPYSAATAYAINDGVTFNGSSFRKLTTAAAGTAPSSASPPVSSADWEVTAAKGLDGTGTGDMVGPPSSVADQFVAFADGEGKNTKAAPYSPANKAGDQFTGPIGSRVGTSGSQQIIRDVGWSALPRRWAEAINADASYSLYSYDGAGSAAAEEFRLSNQGGNALFRGAVRGSNQPCFSAYGTTVSTNWGTIASIGFPGTTKYNVGGGWNTATYTAPVAGLYHFDVGLLVNNAIAGNKNVALTVNGVSSVVSTYIDTNASDTFHPLFLSTDLRLNANDVVAVSTTVSGGTPFFCAGNNGYHHFSGHLVA